MFVLAADSMGSGTCFRGDRSVSSEQRASAGRAAPWRRKPGQDGFVPGGYEFRNETATGRRKTSRRRLRIGWRAINFLKDPLPGNQMPPRRLARAAAGTGINCEIGQQTKSDWTWTRETPHLTSISKGVRRAVPWLQRVREDSGPCAEPTRGSARPAASRVLPCAFPSG
jgi:hypothetical protein